MAKLSPGGHRVYTLQDMLGVLTQDTAAANSPDVQDNEVVDSFAPTTESVGAYVSEAVTTSTAIATWDDPAAAWGRGVWT